MDSIIDHPVPKDLREQMIRRIESMSEEDVTELYELALLQEKLRLRREISDEAEREMATGLWDGLPQLIREYRSARKTA